ncbi:MAG TPA: YbaK/EbsC family protein [Actinomycetota bacterium]|nr:YbaK/EbsC family protein [Actinomycetota bacterium]
MRTSVDVHNFLLERDVPHELVSLRGRLRSPGRMARIAAVLGLPADQVGKVVTLLGNKDLIAVLVPSDREPDLRRVAVAARTPSLEELTSAQVTDLTDYFSESVPPAGLPSGTVVIMDRTLAEQEILYFAGGEATTLLKIRPDDLIRASGAKVARVAK